MENKVSPVEERKLTNAIERAATVASINDTLDRNALLAEQLKKASVDPKFAKTASAAFNKRITVLTFKKTADEHKADPFQLTDADTVFNMLSGKKPEVKVASAPFKMSLEDWSQPMEKAASAQKPVRLYENTVSMQTYLDHLESMMEKHAFAFNDLAALKTRIENSIGNQAKEVAEYFKNASYNYDFTTAVNLYGDKLHEAIKDYMDTDVSFEKTASYVIKPQKEIFDKVAKLISDREALESISDFLSDYGNGLSEFCKTAAEFGEEWLLKKADINSRLQQAQNDQAALDAELTRQRAEAQANSSHGIAPTVTGIGSGILSTIPAAAGTGIGVVNDVAGAAGALLDNAKAKYRAGNNVSIAPGELLDANFLTKDRYRDRLLAWSDMSADPQLAMYPSEQVFQATQKAMDMDTSMERPDQRELLRAQVAQLLAQNNRASTADVAALATTLKALSAARGNAAATSASPVYSASDKTAPEAPVTKDVIGTYGTDTKGLDALRDALLKNVEESNATLDADRAERQKQLDEAVKATAKERGEAIKRVNTLRDQKDEANQTLLTDGMRFMGIRPHTITNGRLSFTQNGAPISSNDVKALIATYLRNRERQMPTV